MQFVKLTFHEAVQFVDEKSLAEIQKFAPASKAISQIQPDGSLRTSEIIVGHYGQWNSGTVSLKKGEYLELEGEVYRVHKPEAWEKNHHRVVVPAK